MTIQLEDPPILPPVDFGVLDRHNRELEHLGISPYDIGSIPTELISYFVVHIRDYNDGLCRIGNSLADSLNKGANAEPGLYQLDYRATGFAYLYDVGRFVSGSPKKTEPIVAFYQEYDDERQHWSIEMWATAPGHEPSQGLRHISIVLTQPDAIEQFIAQSIREFIENPQQGEIVTDLTPKSDLHPTQEIFQLFATGQLPELPDDY